MIPRAVIHPEPRRWAPLRLVVRMWRLARRVAGALWRVRESLMVFAVMLTVVYAVAWCTCLVVESAQHSAELRAMARRSLDRALCEAFDGGPVDPRLVPCLQGSSARDVVACIEEAFGVDLR